jgi:hypothetical protein
MEDPALIDRVPASKGRLSISRAQPDFPRALAAVHWRVEKFCAAFLSSCGDTYPRPTNGILLAMIVMN